jgi:uncharacterized protein YqhQ
VFVLIVTPSVYGAPIEEQISKGIQEGVGEVIDKVTGDLDFSDPNLLNATEEETQSLKDSGKEMIGEVLDLAISSHKFGKSLINFLSPYTIEDFLLTVIAGAITLVFVISIIKRIAFHIMIFIIITFLIIGLLVYFYF